MKRSASWIALFLIPFFCVRSQDFGRRERTFDVQHYAITVRFDEPAKAVIGETRIALQSIRPGLRIVELDAVNMTIEAVALAGGRPLEYQYDSTTLRIALDRPYTYGEPCAFLVRYRCTPRRGLYFIQPNASYPDDPEQIWTQGQGEDNRHWFPCYDYPNDKATTEIYLTVRDAYTTLSNGFLSSRKANGDGTTTWHWVQDKPHSAYLVMLAAGRYRIYEDSCDGVPVQSYHYAADDPADAARTYNTTAEMVRFFSARTGVPYPWAKYAQISVAHFLYGGMENTTATVMNDTRMVVDARAAHDYTADGLIAHELAHQWWGDFLTYIDWQNGWLNEGFATYFQQLWTQHKWGEDEFAYQRTEGISSYRRWTDATGRVPVVTDRPNGGANIYSKGAAVLHMIRGILGEEQFWRALKAYAQKHAFGSVETNDLKRVIEDVTGVNLHWFFEQWLYKAGYPDVRVTKEWDGTARRLRLRFRQMQVIDSLCGVFRLPMRVFIPGLTSPGSGKGPRASYAGSGTAAGIVDTTIWIRTADTTFDLTLASEPVLVSVDHGSAICGRVRLEQAPDELMTQLRENPDVVKRMEAGEELVTHAANKRVRATLFAAARYDPFHGVRLRIASRLSSLKPDTITYADELRKLLIDLCRDAKATVRATALNGLNAFRERSLRKHFLGMLADSSYYVEASAMNCLLGIDSTGTEQIVRERLRKRAWREILPLAALDWVRTYRMRSLEAEVRDAAKPGGTPDLRLKAVETLKYLGLPESEIASILADQMKEPAADIRLAAVSRLTSLVPGVARGMLINHLKTETDRRIILTVQRMLSRN